MRVKIITALFPDDLEWRVNEFLRICQREVVSIQYSSSDSEYSSSDPEYSAMIIFK